MKNSIFAIAIIITLISLSASLSAQISNIPTGDSSTKINTAYCGILSVTNFSYDSLYSARNITIRAGFQATYQPTDWLSVISANGYTIDESGKTSTFTRFWAKTQYSNLQLEAGLVAALSTESMPAPLSADGQFSSSTENTIPGGALGAKMKYNIDDASYFGLGVAQRNSLPEYHLRYSNEQWKVSLYYPEFSKKFGVALNLTQPRWRSVVVFNADQTIGNYTSVKINQQQDIDVYLDLIKDLAEQKVTKLELGLLKTFSSNWLKTTVGLAYNYDNRSVLGYLFVHI